MPVTAGFFSPVNPKKRPNWGFCESVTLHRPPLSESKGKWGMRDEIRTSALAKQQVLDGSIWIPALFFGAWLFFPPLHTSLACWEPAPSGTVHLFLSALPLPCALSLLLFPIFWGYFALSLGSCCSSSRWIFSFPPLPGVAGAPASALCGVPVPPGTGTINRKAPELWLCHAGSAPEEKHRSIPWLCSGIFKDLMSSQHS